MSKAKPCPFCGRTPQIKSFFENCHVVVCKCGAESPRDSKSINGAIRIWNRRRYEEYLCQRCGKIVDGRE